MQTLKKLAIITTHPIQYYAPIFKLLAKSLELKVFYSGGQQLINQYDYGFKKQIIWDLSLLDGYDHEFLPNVAEHPGSHHFKGIVNPDAIVRVDKFKPSAILIYGWSYQSHLKLIRHYKGKIPIYFRGDSTLLDQQKILKRIVRKHFLKWIYSHVDKVFYVGKANKAYFRHFGLREEQLFFAPHAIDNNRFAEEKTSESMQLRAKLGIKRDEILILFAGKLEPKKNPKLLLEAFIAIYFDNMHLLFVGNGVLESRLKGCFDAAQNEKLERKLDDNQHSSELSVESWEEKSFDPAQDGKLEGTHDDKLRFTPQTHMKKRIHFMDFQNQSQMPAVYQACDLFCLPSQGPGESWGLAVNEAMAAGKAVLVSDKTGCAADLVKPAINGDIFKSGNLADLKQKLRKLTESKAKLVQMGLVSQQIIQEWSFEKQVTIIVDAIENKYAE